MSKTSIVDVAPCKQFFINSLTRDISLINCIYDLVDNAINGADREMLKYQRKKSDYKGFCININFNQEIFTIRDNCGGIEVKHAIDYVFKFGYDTNDVASYSSSGFGIGMKRAFFKFGKRIHMISCTSNSKVEVDIDVVKWLKRNKWEFEIHYDYNTYSVSETIIQVKQLSSEISTAFSNPNFEIELIEELRKKYSKMISDGLKIYVNNKEIIYGIKLREKIYSNFMTIGRVSITIVIYKCNAEPKDLGWYINFNGNNVVTANNDKMTGWGQDEKDKIEWDDNFFHGFYGTVSCTTKDMTTLPLKTTKELDTELDFYQKLVPILIESVETSKHKFGKVENETTSIQYKRPKVLVDELKAYFNVKSAADVGRKTFDYCYNNKNKR